MYRIDSEGATVDNLFTEGDPGTGVPATVVAAEWLNHSQEELAKFIEHLGITLSKLDRNQLQAAILELHLRGGRNAPLSQDIDNNAGPLDVAGVVLDRTVIKCWKADILIERKTDSNYNIESGTIHVVYDAALDAWRVALSTNLDDAGVVFTMTQIAATDEFKLQYTSDDLTGTTYSGTVKFINIRNYRL